MKKSMVSSIARIDYSHGARRLQSFDVYYETTSTSAKPVLIFVGGGGWQQTSINGDHFNHHPTLAAEWVRAGYVVVVLRHRPKTQEDPGCGLLG